MLDRPPLNRDTSVPLYVQIAEIVRRDIENGTLRPGERLPNELEMADRYGVSRLTVRKSFQILSREGILTQRQGKGTFIQEMPPIREGLSSLHSLSTVIEQHGAVPRVDVLNLRMIKAPPAVARKLRLDPGNDTVLYIERRHRIDNDPVALAMIYLPYELGKDFTAKDVESKSILSLLRERHHIRLKEGQESIWASSAGRSMARLLDIGVQAPVLVAELLTCSDEGVPVELIALFYRGDMYEVSVNLPWTDDVFPMANAAVRSSPSSLESRIHWPELGA